MAGPRVGSPTVFSVPYRLTCTCWWRQSDRHEQEGERRVADHCSPPRDCQSSSDQPLVGLAQTDKQEIQTARTSPIWEQAHLKETLSASNPKPLQYHLQQGEAPPTITTTTDHGFHLSIHAKMVDTNMCKEGGAEEPRQIQRVV